MSQTTTYLFTIYVIGNPLGNTFIGEFNPSTQSQSKKSINKTQSTSRKYTSNHLKQLQLYNNPIPNQIKHFIRINNHPSE